MFWTKSFTAFVLLGALLGIYLFVSAPPPLPAHARVEGPRVSVRELFDMVAAENATVRTLYTSRIVGPGKEVGLSFDEDWQKPEVQAGPLPALFLRETARNLERRPPPLGLFLGSDAPIAEANLFTGSQQLEFEQMRVDEKPRYFVVPDTGLQTAMYPDYASAAACVDCHNGHSNSPKKDWKLGDMMGATTWTYPDATLSVQEALGVLRALRESFQETYQTYVHKAQTFDNPPSIGERWPTHGYYLPSPEVFMAEAQQLASSKTLQILLAQ